MNKNSMIFLYDSSTLNTSFNNNKNHSSIYFTLVNNVNNVKAAKSIHEARYLFDIDAAVIVIINIGEVIRQQKKEEGLR